VVETLHGIAVADPWRWLENDVRQDRDVAAWVGHQNTLTDGYLAALPDRERIRTRLTALWDFEKFSEPTRRGMRYFFRRNDGLQSQAVLYVQEGLTGAPRVLLDPNTWAADGPPEPGR
jgi:prolyl oligopeptidase